MKHNRRRARVRGRACALALLLVAAACGVAQDEPPSSPRAIASRPLARRTAPSAASDADIERFDLVVHGSVERSLAAAGLRAHLADELDDAFVGRIDVFAHLGDNSRFTLWLLHGHLVAARLSLGGATPLFAALYEGALAPRGFYDEAGRAMTSALLSRPVRLRHITSRFGERFDGTRREIHHGIDYGVPLDTPVVAIGDAAVKRIACSPASGNFVELAHASGFTSFYLHLDRVAPQLHVGDFVRQGDVIALSGNTGHSTGPHLHYELHLDGTALDPLATLPPPTTALGPMARREHLAFLKLLEAMHDRRTDGQDEHPGARP